MSLIVDVEADNVRAPLAKARIKDIAVAVLESERVRDAMLSITLVTRQHIARLNRRHLGHAGPTDVISFALGEMSAPSRSRVIVGDIYIAPDVARANAARVRGGVREEIARLVVHGTLHVLGHDHPDAEDRTTSPMWRRQEQLVARAMRRTTSKRGAR